ncbi:hypothetical protein BHU62_12040 [Serratia marcescens]|uniref:Uncharacterized protein n=1 Tax=Serratia marcescens TaxID=615 RepID=A0A1Q4P0E3_SERMA|nr:hypothetical protein BHU62_12040 [Serratia marcescens]
MPVGCQAEAETLLKLIFMRQKIIQTFAQARNLIMPNTRWDIGSLAFLVVGYGRSQTRQPCAIQQGKTQRISLLIQFVQQCQKFPSPGNLQYFRKALRHTWKLAQFGGKNTFLSTQNEKLTYLIKAGLQASISTAAIGSVQPPTDNDPQ